MTQSAPISGHDDPADEAPWAMQIVVQIEKTQLPAATAVIEAVAHAAASLLSAPEAQSGSWAEAISRWEEGRIRKVVRRARGAAFARATTVEGRTATLRGVSVHACVPGPTDQLPEPLRRLQVSGLELEDSARYRTLPEPSGALTIAMSPFVALSAGKAAAQAAHASQLALRRMSPQRLVRWESADLDVRVIHPSQEVWDVLLTTAPVQITDAGFTEIPPGTRTCAALF